MTLFPCRNISTGGQMKSLKKIIFLGIFLSASIVFASPAQVIIIRHGEKPESGNSLSPQGWARARALVKYFETNPDVTQFGTPVAIYASRAEAEEQVEGSSLRMIQTVTPLAQALGLKINSTYA